jgi:hypothetical protein
VLRAYTFLLKFTLIWHQDLHLALNLLHFLPELGVLSALRHAPNFCEIHPRSTVSVMLQSLSVLGLVILPLALNYKEEAFWAYGNNDKF